MTTKLTKGCLKGPKLRQVTAKRGVNNCEAWQRLRNSNETTEDSKNPTMNKSIKVKGESPLNHTEIPRTNSRLKSDTVIQEVTTERNVKSSWGSHKDAQIPSDCGKCKKLIQAIKEKNSVIDKINKEKVKLEEQLRNMMRGTIKLPKDSSTKRNQSIKHSNNFWIIDTNIERKGSLHASSTHNSAKSILLEKMQERKSPKNSIDNVNKKLDSSLDMLKTLESYISQIKTDVNSINDSQKRNRKGIFNEELTELRDKIGKLVVIADKNH